MREQPRNVPVKDALRVWWEGEEVWGVLAYGLRRPGPLTRPVLDNLWPEPYDYSDPWVLGGPGWEVELWTVRLSAPPPASARQGAVEGTLMALIAAGCQVSWLAAEGDFVDPPDLLDPRYMGQGLYAGFSRETGLLFHGWHDSLETLGDHELLALSEPPWV